MTATLVRAGAMITRSLDRTHCETIADGAFVQEDGVIVETGTHAALSARYRDMPVIGAAGDVMLPGFVNAHHHVGLTPFQLGAPDLPLELWAVARMAARDVDPYLDTLYSAFEMIASGVTTVQHIHDAVPGTPDAIRARLDAVARAYEDIGMRASICYGFDDQNRFANMPDADFLARLPADLAARLAEGLAGIEVGIEENVAIFEAMHAEKRGSRRIRVQLAPANLHWCSDRALERLSETARAHGVPLHMHLLETPYQRDYGFTRNDGGAFRHLERFGLQGPHMTIGHAVWFGPEDIERAAETGTSICHNCSSNFRLRSGRAPLRAFEAAGINVAIGIDEAGLNDDRDMLQEMRLVLDAHRRPGPEEDAPGVGQVLRMATEGGARTTAFGETIGVIAPGRAADVTLFDLDAIAHPYLDPAVPLADAVLRRAKSRHVRLVMCDGKVIYRDGRFTMVDRAAVLRELHDRMAAALSADERDRRDLARALLPHVRGALGGEP